MTHVTFFQRPLAFLGRIVFFILLLMVLGNRGLRAQILITSNDGGESNANNLYAAVTTINGTNDGGSAALSFTGSNSVTLEQELIPVSQSVTFVSDPSQAISIFAENESEGELDFAETLSLGTGVTFSLLNDGTGGQGTLDASVTALNLSMGVSADLSVTGGELDDSSGVIIGNEMGGSAAVTTGSIILSDTDDTFAITGGELNNSDSGFIIGIGAGGNAAVTTGSIILSDMDDTFAVTGGELDNSGVITNGNTTGGNASVTAGTITLSGAGDTFTVVGGELDNIETGTSGYDGISRNGTGGNASVTVGMITLSGADDTFAVTGGELDNSIYGLISGNVTGGNASVSAGMITLSDADDTFTVAGAELDNSNYGIIDGNGTSGNAAVTAGMITLSGTDDLLTVTGGELDNSNFGTIYQNGTGGTATLMATNLTMAAGTTVSVAGGLGIDASDGNASVSIGTLTGSGVVTMWGNTALLQVNQGNFAGVLAGNESLQQLGSGALTLTGANTYSGGTSISGGDLVIQNDGNLGAGGTTLTLDGGTIETTGSWVSSRDVVITTNNGAIDLDGNSDSLSGMINGTGSLLVTSSTGSGSITLTSANTYSGGTQVSGGDLVAQNSSALGTGQVLVTGGTLMLSHTQLQLSGNYTQTSQGTLQLGLGGVFNNSDFLSIQGVALLGGVLKLNSYNDFVPPTGDIFYVIQAVDGISGKFSQVDTAISGVRLLPIYLSDQVALESVVSSFAMVASTANEKSVGADLDSLFNNSNENTLIASLGELSTKDLQTALGEISPEGLTGLYQSGFTQTVLETSQISQRLVQLRQTAYEREGTAQAYSMGETPMFASTLPASDEAAMISPETQDGWSGFADGSGGSFNVSGTGGYQTSSESMVTAGMDRSFSKTVEGGLMVSYGQTQLELNSGGSMGIEGGQLGCYGTWSVDPFYVNSAVFGGPENISSQRNGYGGAASGSTDGETYGGLVGVGYNLQTDQMRWGPIGSVQYTHIQINGYSEQGSLAPLEVSSQGADSWMSQLGVQGQGKWVVGGVRLIPSVNLAWEHEFDDQGGNMDAGFGQGDSFTVSGPSVGSDGLLTQITLEVAFSKEFNLNVNYTGQMGRSNLTSNQVGGGIGLLL